MSHNAKLIPIGSFLVDQGLANLGQFIGVNFDPSSFVFTDEGNLVGLRINPAALPAGEDVQAVRFSWDTPSPLVLEFVQAGWILNRAALLVSTAFDDPAAFLRLGTVTSPDLIFGPAGAKVSAADQYEHVALVTFPINDILQLVISSGASTQGEGLLLYKTKR
jgi:hypothetical protein